MVAPQPNRAEGVFVIMADYNSDQALAAEYALGVLEGAEKRVFEDRLTREPELRDMYAAWADEFSVMDTDEVVPPDHIKVALDEKIFGPPAPWWHKFRLPSLGLVTAGILLCVFLFAWPSYPDQTSTMRVDTFAMQAELYEDDRLLKVSIERSDPPEGRDHELWIIPDGEAPISLGVVADGQLIIPDEINLAGAILAITVEAKGGSPDGNPTSAPLVAAGFEPV